MANINEKRKKFWLNNALSLFLVAAGVALGLGFGLTLGKRTRSSQPRGERPDDVTPQNINSSISATVVPSSSKIEIPSIGDGIATYTPSNNATSVATYNESNNFSFFSDTPSSAISSKAYSYPSVFPHNVNRSLTPTLMPQSNQSITHIPSIVPHFSEDPTSLLLNETSNTTKSNETTNLLLTNKTIHPSPGHLSSYPSIFERSSYSPSNSSPTPSSIQHSSDTPTIKSTSRTQHPSALPSPFLPPKFTSENVFNLLSNFSNINGTIESTQFQAYKWMTENKTFDNSYDEYGIIQRYVLALLYFTTEGKFWINQNNFLSDSHVCSWNDIRTGFASGVVECNEDLHITKLSLESVSMIGTIPQEFGELVTLKSLNFDTNDLQGSIPRSFTKLKSIEEVRMQSNFMTGNVSFLCESWKTKLKLFHVDRDEIICPCCDCCPSTIRQ